MKFNVGDRVIVISLDWTEDVGIAGRDAVVEIRDPELKKYAIRFEDDGMVDVVPEDALAMLGEYRSH